MFQKNIQWFVDRLMERIVPTVGSYMTAALQRMLILSHAEHHNQLEEQAQRYEAVGRPEIAALIRDQAKHIALDRPLPQAQAILEEFDAANPTLFEGTPSGVPLALPDSFSSRRPKSRKRPADEVSDVEGDEQ